MTAPGLINRLEKTPLRTSMRETIRDCGVSSSVMHSGGGDSRYFGFETFFSALFG
jgi:hypothetical protein